MAGLLDDLKEKSGGLLGQLNDYLFKDTGSKLPTESITDPETSMLNYQRGLPKDPTDKTAGQYGGMFDKRLPQYPVGESTPSMTINNKPFVDKTAKPESEVDKDSILKRVLGKEVLAWFDKAGTSWKDSGGFEKLMADPGFLIGLGILENAANGKSIGSGALDSMVKAGAISSAYADRIKARAKIQGPVTAAEREEAKAVLAESDLGETASISTRFKNFILGKNTEALNARALDDIAERARTNMENDANKGAGGKVRSRREYYEDAAKQLVKEGKIKIDEGFWILGGGVQSTKPGLTNINKIPENNKRQLGGPVTKNESYLVGEVGPEVFIPKVSGKIVSNDDSKIINLLLEANPQLKNVSPARAEKILRNRFPDYFE